MRWGVQVRRGRVLALAALGLGVLAVAQSAAAPLAGGFSRSRPVSWISVAPGQRGHLDHAPDELRAALESPRDLDLVDATIGEVDHSPLDRPKSRRVVPDRVHAHGSKLPHPPHEPN